MGSVNRFFLQAGLFLLGLWALVKLYPLLLWVFFAFTLAAALDPLVGFFERGPGGLGRRFPRPTAVFLAYALVLSVFALGFYAAFPLLSAQFKNLSQLLPAYLERLLATTDTPPAALDDAAIAAWRLFQAYTLGRAPTEAVAQGFADAQHGRELAQLGFQADLAYCSQLDVSAVVPALVRAGDMLLLQPSAPDTGS